MSPLIPNLDEILKIPIGQQHPDALKAIKDRRQELANLFFDKTKTAAERNAVFDELNNLNKYLSYKILEYRIKEKGSGGNYRIVTPADREKNCQDFAACLLRLGVTDITSNAFAIVWSNTR